MRGVGMKKILTAAAILLMATPAAAEDAPVVLWFTDTLQDVSDKLANLCVDRQSAVVEQDERHVLCQKEVSGAQGVLAQALLGNSYSTSPIYNVRFSLLRDGDLVRVQASQWIELQMAMGQVRRTPLNNKKQRENIVSLLIAKGGSETRPSSTTSEPSAPATAVKP